MRTCPVKCCSCEDVCRPCVPSLLSDDRVEGVVEPLHSQIHHFSQGVVLCALILIGHRLIGRGGAEREWIKTNKKTIHHTRCSAVPLTLVSKHIWIIFPSTVTQMFLSSLKSTHSSPNMSLKTERPNITRAVVTVYTTVDNSNTLICVYVLMNEVMWWLECHPLQHDS